MFQSKSMLLLGALAIVVLAIVGVSSAVASVHIETCMKNLEECKTSTPGTTFATSGGTIEVEGMEGEEKDVCTVATKGEVVDPTSEKAGDEMKLSITSAEFTKCTLGELKPTGLPWVVETDAPTYEKEHQFSNFRLKFTSWTGCKYEEDPPFDTMFEKIVNASPRSFILGSGLMVKAEEQFGCWILRKVHTLMPIVSISDSNLLGSNLCIK
jgi:hypothetical protein